MIETVEVPVKALEALRDSRLGHGTPQGDYATVLIVEKALANLVAFIPEPPKVGDTITGQQFAALPPRSVAIDTDGDVWIRTNDEDATIVEKTSVYASHNDVVTSPDALYASTFSQGTLVHIGRTEEDE